MLPALKVIISGVLNRLRTCASLLAVGLAVIGMLPERSAAQEVAYGVPAGLAGTLWIFVYTGTQMSVRADILKKLGKELPRLRYADDARQADVVLVYATAESDVFVGNWGQAVGAGSTTCSSFGSTATCSSNGQASGYSMPLYGRVRYGRGLVMVRGQDGELRLVLEHADDSKALGKSPQSKFTSRFIKEYKKQNPVTPADRPPRSLIDSGASSSTGVVEPPTGNQNDRLFVYSGDYTASVAPGTTYHGRMTLRFHGNAVSGTLETNTGRYASVAGLNAGGQLTLNFRFSDQCPGTARGEARIDGGALTGSYAASDCSGDYSGTFALLLEGY
jgi:hypothetical protein